MAFDPLTAGFSLLTAVIEHDKMLFNAMSPDKQAEFAEKHFERITLVLDTMGKLFTVFKPKE